MEVNKTAIEVNPGSLFKGLKMYREVINCVLNIKDDNIVVNYEEYLVAPDGSKLEVKNKTYIVIDEPEITKIEKDVNGNIVNDGELLFIDEAKTEPFLVLGVQQKDGSPNIIIDTPAKNQYTDWKNFIISSELVGASLGNDIIIGTIRKTLKDIPFEAESGYITQP